MFRFYLSLQEMPCHESCLYPEASKTGQLWNDLFVPCFVSKCVMLAKCLHGQESSDPWYKAGRRAFTALPEPKRWTISNGCIQFVFPRSADGSPTMKCRETWISKLKTYESLRSCFTSNLRICFLYAPSNIQLQTSGAFCIPSMSQHCLFSRLRLERANLHDIFGMCRSADEVQGRMHASIIRSMLNS